MPDRVTRNIIVKADEATVYKLWADFENFPQFMKHIQSVRKTGPRASHWTMVGPLGRKVEWDAETTRLEENKRIGWSTKDHDGMTTSGEVLFTSLSHGETEITVTMQYIPPAGMAGKVVAELFSDPEKDLEEDLRHFKKYVEGMRTNVASQAPGTATIT